MYIVLYVILGAVLFTQAEAQTSLIALYVGDTLRCSGSMYNQYYVITGGQCTSLITGTVDTRYFFSVIVGTTDLNSGGVRHLVKQVFYPPNNTLDIALIKLETPIESSGAKAVPLDKNPMVDYANVTILSWSNNKAITGPVATYIPTTRCTPQFNTQLCIEYTSNGTCGMGAPIISNGKQVGIKGYPKNCVSKDIDVATRISSYYNWIVATAT